MNIIMPAKEPLLVPGLIAWNAADDPNGNGILPSNSASISTIKNKYGSAYNWGASGGARPTYTYNSLNGLPGITFNAASANWMSHTDLYPNPSTNQHIFMVISIDFTNSVSGFPNFFQINGTRVPLNYSVASAKPEMVLSYTNGGGEADILFTTSTTPGFGDNIPMIVIQKNAAGACTARVIATGFDSIGSGGLTPSFSGDGSGTSILGGNGLGSYTQAIFYELLYYNRPLTTAETLLINRYLCNKWGLRQPT